jgi:uncharacterized membrane protein
MTNYLVGWIGLLLALAAVAGSFWLSRVVATRRLRAAANTYAERVLAQERRRQLRRSSLTRGS